MEQRHNSPSKGVPITVYFSPEEAMPVEEFRIRAQIPSLSKAIRYLVKVGLQASQPDAARAAPCPAPQRKEAAPATAPAPAGPPQGTRRDPA